MIYNEFRKWLKAQGVVFISPRNGGGHWIIRLGDRSSVFPFHGSKEMKKGLVEGIKKQLGLK